MMMKSTKTRNLLILHGWGKGASSYEKFLQHWNNKDVKVYVPDMPGFGKNKQVKDTFDVDDYVSWLHEYITTNIKHGEIILYGHSFGGKVAAGFIRKYPKIIKKVIFCESNIFKEPLSFRQKVLKNLATIAKKLKIKKPKKLPKFLIASKDYAKANPIMKNVFVNALREDYSSVISQIKIPTLIIWGDKDNYLPCKNAYKMQRLIPNSELKIIKKCGHIPHITHTEELNNAILDWI